MCRLYARYFMGDKVADCIMRFLCSFQFFNVYRFWPDFLKPEHFSEKLWSRMLHERNPLLTLISDKFRVRDYVAQKVGNNYLIPLLWYGSNPEKIPFQELPQKFVIKTNHGCGYNIIVSDKKNLDRRAINTKLNKWLNENYCQDQNLGLEWGYKNIKPIIIIESFIGNEDKPPIDYKFYCFAGHVEIVTVHFDRFEEHKAKAFDRNFKPYKFLSDFEQYGGHFERPDNFVSMLAVAESLAVDFDFIRVDLYSQENNIYFGELTPYPAGISNFRGFDMRCIDDILGKKWKTKQGINEI